MQRLTPSSTALAVEEELDANAHSAVVAAHSASVAVAPALLDSILETTVQVQAQDTDVDLILAIDSILAADSEIKRKRLEQYCPACGKSPCESAFPGN